MKENVSNLLLHHTLIQTECPPKEVIKKAEDELFHDKKLIKKCFMIAGHPILHIEGGVHKKRGGFHGNFVLCPAIRLSPCELSE